jgi:AraC family transcriptional activator of pobA
MAARRARRAPQEAVPTVAFYGDAKEWATSALLHSEPLIERSRQHAWIIRPHRHLRLTQLFWLARGRGTGRFDAERYRLEAPCVAVIPERCVHEFEWDQDSDGFALSLASGLLAELHRALGASGEALATPAVLGAGDAASYLGELFAALHAEYVSERPHKELALDSGVRALAVWIARAGAPAHRTAESGSRASRHYERFTKLLEAQHAAQWTVARYAAEIGITAPHLNAICKALGGAPASRLIHERLLLAARRALAYTDRSIADVGASLGFEEPSYFTRFFKRTMHTTPKQYRRSAGTVPR